MKKFCLNDFEKKDIAKNYLKKLPKRSWMGFIEEKEY